jgi:hypothetical protein
MDPNIQLLLKQVSNKSIVTMNSFINGNYYTTNVDNKSINISMNGILIYTNRK